MASNMNGQPNGNGQLTCQGKPKPGGGEWQCTNFGWRRRLDYIPEDDKRLNRFISFISQRR